MANKKYVNRLLKDVETWNVWRVQHSIVEQDFSDANLIGAHLKGANLKGANLKGAHLIGANLKGADLRSADLSGADLNSAHLIGADLTDADLTDANLSWANLSGTNLSWANLSWTNLSGANLSWTNLSGAKLKGTRLHRAIIGWTSFGDLDLRMVKGLDTIYHEGPSPLSINTYSLSAGDIPESFLRGTGANDTFINYAKSLNYPIEYSPCFISYSNKDQVFAEQLYNDLQGKNIQCWCIPEDLKTEDLFWKRIGESIRADEKLLVILSTESVECDWMEREVMAAIEKEDQHKKHILFPLLLDDKGKTTSTSWAADMRRRRHITDFTNWDTDYTMYQKGFSRLLRDLKTKSTMTQT